MDVLLLQPRMPYPKGRISCFDGNMPPLALLYLAEPLLEKGFDTQILDLGVHDHMDGPGFKHYIETNRPSVVGISSSTQSINRALKAAAYVKSVDPGITVVLGGPHVTFTAKETLKSPYVDVVVRGEGDRNFPQLVEHFIKGKFSLGEIAGISFRQDGEIKETPGKIIEDIDSLSFPSRDLVDLSRYLVPATISTSRGCPFNCRFCAAGALSGGKYRMRSVENIIAEIDDLVGKCQCRYLCFLDDTLTAFPDRTRALCKHFIKKDYSFQWFCESRVDVTDKEMLTLMARAGCAGMQFGFESGSPEILASIGKNINPAQMETSVKRCLEAGIQPVGSFLIGFPEDTGETVNQTIQMTRKLKKMGAVTFIVALTPLPGTYYYDHAKELGLTIHASDWDDYEVGCPVVSTRHFTCDEIREILFDISLEIQDFPGVLPPAATTHHCQQTSRTGM